MKIKTLQELEEFEIDVILKISHERFICFSSYDPDEIYDIDFELVAKLYCDQYKEMKDLNKSNEYSLREYEGRAEICQKLLDMIREDFRGFVEACYLII